MKANLLLVLMLFASFVHATKTAVTTSTLAATWTAAANGDTLLLAAGSYSNALALQNGKVITLKGTGKVVYTGTVGAGALTDTGTGIIFDGLTINRGNSYVLDGTTFGDISIVAFRNDTILNVQRCLVRGSNTTIKSLATIEVTNCIIRNCGTGGYALFNPKFYVQNVTVKNNTMIRYYGENLYLPNATLATNVLNFSFENNTVFKWSKLATYAICNSAATNSTSSTFTIKNNIFAESCPATPGIKPLLLKATGGNVIAQKNLIINYGRFSLTSPVSIDTASNNLSYSNANLYNPAIGFQDTTTTSSTATSALNFGILSSSSLATASTTGGVIGDTRWLKVVSTPATISTSVTPASAGTTTPLSTTVNVGDNVIVTATKAFGYTFKEWRDAGTDALVSTSNPYSVTIAANTSLVAVFDPVTTYNFTLDKLGDGATWGVVTLSPTPTGGKYETGTSVTMTPVSNVVSTFTQWENATTGTRTVSITGDVTYSATFTASPFITAWDFNPAEPRGPRTGDYNYISTNQGLMKFYATTGSTTSWGGSTIASKTCARRYTDLVDMPAKCRSFVTEVSTKGYKSIQVKSKIAYDNNLVHTIQKIQYSIDGTSFNDLTTADMSSKSKNTWYSFNATLPTAADNVSKIYVRWIGDVTSSLVGTLTSETSEGFYLADVVISGATMANAASGDYIATASGDISLASNWSISGGAFGITGVASIAPTETTNLWVPTGITMSNSSIASCKDLNISGSYTASSTLNVAGNLNILSNTSGTGTLIDNENISVTGTSNVQQHLTGALTTELPSGRFWYVSSPVASATSATFDAAGRNKIWNYTESAHVYNEINANDSTLTVGRGYAVRLGTDTMVTFSGVLNTGDKTIYLSRTDGNEKSGYNLIGNPYPSFLDWHAATVSASVLPTSIWTRSCTTGGSMAFDTYNASLNTGVSGSGNTVTQYIAPMQAFWVKVDAGNTTGSVSFTNAMRSIQDITLTTNKLKAPAVATQQLLRLQVSNGTNSDETVIAFNANASDGFDNFDSPKMSNNNLTIPEIYTLAGTEKIAINGMKNISTMPLGFTTGESNTFSIKATEINNFDADTKVILKDNLLNTEQELNDGTAYNFTSEVSTGTSRFSIVFKTVSITTGIESTNLNVNIFKNVNGHITINRNDASQGFVTVSNAIGQNLVNSQTTGVNTVINKTFGSGVYFVTLNVAGVKTTKKVIIN